MIFVTVFEHLLRWADRHYLRDASASTEGRLLLSHIVTIATELFLLEEI